VPAANAATTTARPATVVTADDIYAEMPDSRSPKLKAASARSRESLSPAPRAMPATQVVTGRDGRPTLTNTMRALRASGVNQ
jgi:hypothetical protein